MEEESKDPKPEVEMAAIAMPTSGRTSSQLTPLISSGERINSGSSGKRKRLGKKKKKK